MQTFSSVPGAVVVVVQGDKTVYQRGLGYANLKSKQKMTEATNFYIASCTKSFTALAAALYDQKGLIDLDAPITKYFPDVKFDPALKAENVKVGPAYSHLRHSERRHWLSRGVFRRTRSSIADETNGSLQSQQGRLWQLSVH